MSRRTKNDFERIDNAKINGKKTGYESYLNKEKVRTKGLFQLDSQKAIKNPGELQRQNYLDLLKINP